MRQEVGNNECMEAGGIKDTRAGGSIGSAAMVLSERQKSALYQKEALERAEKTVDVFRIIEALYATSSGEAMAFLNAGQPGQPVKFILPRVILGKKVLHRLVLDMHLVIQAMPQHLLGVLLASNCGVLRAGPNWSEGLTDCKLTDSGPLEHLVRGAGVLVTMLELLPRYRQLHGMFSDDSSFAASVLDLVLAMALSAAGPLWDKLQQAHTPADRLLLTRALCGCVCWSVALLVTLWGVPGPEASPGSEYAYSTVVRKLLAQAQGPEIIHALLDACSVMLCAVQQQLQQHHMSSAVLQLFGHPLMHHATLLVSPGGAHIMRVLSAATGLASLLNDNAASKEGIVPLLLGRCFSMMVQLSEFQQPALIDTLVLHDSSRARLQHFIATACGVAQHYFKPLPKAAGPVDSSDDAAVAAALAAEAGELKPGEAQLLLSVLRLLELASDDSNLREATMGPVAAVMAAALAAESVSFNARWCGGDVAVSQHIHDFIQLGSTTASAVKDVNKITGISRWLVQGKALNRKQGKLTSRFGAARVELDISKLGTALSLDTWEVICNSTWAAARFNVANYGLQRQMSDLDLI
eukprot:gene4132-4378_t